jgi:uncharacterized membrane protein YkvI
MLRFLKIYLLPGAVLQSVMIGGGYGTGRELVEFFTRHGIADGFAGQLLATALVSIIFSLTLALAVRHGAYDYRHFFQLLLGRAWILFELLLVTLFVLVLAVMGSAAGGILEDTFGLPERAGAVVMLILVVTLTFFGRDLITRVLASWSVLLYAVFISYFIAVMSGLTEADLAGKLDWDFQADWMISGLQYALYNVSAVPIVLYAARAIETEAQAYASGIIGGLIAMIPGMLFHLSFIGAYPGILEAELPVYAQFESLAMPVLYGLYLLVLFGTFIETGAGNIQGFIERVDGWWQERRATPLKRIHHACIAGAALIIASILSDFGIVDLIAQGYGGIAWGFLFVYLIPLFTVGIYRLARSPSAAETIRPPAD